MATESHTSPADEAHPTPTPFSRGVSRRGDLALVKDSLTTAAIACTGLHTEDGEAIAGTLFEATRRIERLVEDQDAELSAITAAERKEAEAAPKPAPPNAEAAKSAWELMDEVNNDLSDIRKLAHTIFLAGLAIAEHHSQDGEAVSHLGITIRDQIEATQTVCGWAMESCRPDRQEFREPQKYARADAALVLLGGDLADLLRSYVPARLKGFAGDEAAAEQADALTGRLDELMNTINALPAKAMDALAVKAMLVAATNVSLLNDPAPDWGAREVRKLIESVCASLGISLDPAAPIDDGNGEVEEAAGDA